jgi:hypothetical protein
MYSIYDTAGFYAVNGLPNQNENLYFIYLLTTLGNMWIMGFLQIARILYIRSQPKSSILSTAVYFSCK